MRLCVHMQELLNLAGWFGLNPAGGELTSKTINAFSKKCFLENSWLGKERPPNVALVQKVVLQCKLTLRTFVYTSTLYQCLTWYVGLARESKYQTEGDGKLNLISSVHYRPIVYTAFSSSLPFICLIFQIAETESSFLLCPLLKTVVKMKLVHNTWLFILFSASCLCVIFVF